MLILSSKALPVTVGCLCLQSVGKMLEYLLAGESALKKLEILYNF